MTFPRRTFLQLAGAASVGVFRPELAFALDYPTKPVRLIVGLPPGGAPDLTARLVGQWLSERLSQPVLIENRPGAGGNVAAEAVIRAKPDGYSLLLVGTPNIINAALRETDNLDFTRDISPVAMVTGNSPFVLVVNPAFPVKTIPEFITYAKANPGAVNMASTGTGNMSHVSGELFKMLAGVDLLHVPFRGEALAQQDLLSGRVQVMFDVLSASIEYIRSGMLRALGVTTAQRVAVLPDIPAIGEFVPGYEMSAMSGIAAPLHTPRDIVDLLNREINAGLADPRIGGRIGDIGSPVMAISPDEFGRTIADQKEKWTKVIKFAGVKAE